MVQRSSIEPVVWHPTQAPPRLRRHDRPTLPPLRLIPVNGLGPETVIVDADGDLLTGLDGGRILRVRADGRQITEVANTDGRPLGMGVLPDGDLIVADAYRGLLRVSTADGEVELIADGTDGEPFQFCKDVAVAADETVYFTDASRRFGLHEWKAELLEHSGSGRLLRRRPDGVIEVLADGLQFANGIALAPDESCVFVAETGAFQVIRVWLTGPKAGVPEIMLDGLGGYPWGLNLGSDQRLWVAMASPRQPVLEMLASRPPRLRKALWALPERYHPQPIPDVAVLALNITTGRIEKDLHGPPDWEFSNATGVVEHLGVVYVSGVAARAMAAFDVP